MNLSIYAIKVGTTTLSQLDVNKELDIDFYSRPKDNPDYTSSERKHLMMIQIKIENLMFMMFY